ncbi:energy transducer TonB [Flavobacterium sp.]|uniref:energy transducer TonB n=1 Tax=Flavobacterium sp. TaxID=239 RepID=UPI0025EBA25D|nr:energy transducer TonB [Flavobacterium sp.]
MKIIYTILLFSSALFAKAQEVNLPTETIESTYSLMTLEVKPEFQGGMEEFYKYIGQNFKVPKNKDFFGGRVIVSFVIEKDGSVTEVKVLKDCGFGTAEEAKRVLLNCPKWKPATQKNVPVRCQYALPINVTRN